PSPNFYVSLSFPTQRSSDLRIQEKYNLPRPIVVADSGLLSKANIKSLIDMGYQFILGARIKSETRAMQQRILSAAQVLRDGEAIDRKSTRLNSSHVKISYAV